MVSSLLGPGHIVASSARSPRLPFNEITNLHQKLQDTRQSRYVVLTALSFFIGGCS